MEDIINSFFLDTFYQLCVDFVKNYPKSNNPCDRLQTFAAIESYADLNTPSLGKTIHDRGKPFFFSRKWASQQYSPSHLSHTSPIMIAFEEPGVIESPFDKVKTVKYKLQIAFLDAYEPTKKASECGGRTRNEIYYNTERFLHNFFAYLREVKYYSGHGFYNSQIAQAELTNAVENVSVTRKFQKMLKSQNAEVLLSRWEGGIKSYFGTYTTLTLDSVTCDDIFYDPDVNEYVLSFDRNCC